MEFGKLSGAPLSKSYTVALLYRSAAAAEKMKEAEVVKKKIIKVGGGGGERGGKPPPPEAGETLSIIWFYTAECSHRRGTVYGVKRRKSSKHSGSRRGSCAFPAERSWEAGRREPASQGQAPPPTPEPETEKGGGLSLSHLEKVWTGQLPGLTREEVWSAASSSFQNWLGCGHRGGCWQAAGSVFLLPALWLFGSRRYIATCHFRKDALPPDAPSLGGQKLA